MGYESIKENLIIYGLVIIGAILFFSTCGSIERNTGVEKIIEISVVGINNVWKRKYIIGFLTALLIWSVVWIPNIFKVIANFGLNGMTAPLGSFLQKDIVFSKVYMWTYLFVYMCLNLIIVSSIICGIIYISKKWKNQSISIAISIVLFLFPDLFIYILL